MKKSGQEIISYSLYVPKPDTCIVDKCRMNIQVQIWVLHAHIKKLPLAFIGRRFILNGEEHSQ